MSILDVARRRWRRVLLVLAVLYIASPWVQLDAGTAALGLRVPHVQVVGWYRDYGGFEGFRICNSRPDCNNGIWASPFDAGPVRAPVVPGGRYVPPERR